MLMYNCLKIDVSLKVLFLFKHAAIYFKILRNKGIRKYSFYQMNYPFDVNQQQCIPGRCGVWSVRDEPVYGTRYACRSGWTHTGDGNCNIRKALMTRLFRV